MKRHTKPLKLGRMTWQIGPHSPLPAGHPVTRRLIAAGMAKLVFLDDYLRFEDLARESG